MSNSDVRSPIGNNPNPREDIFADLQVIPAPSPVIRMPPWAAWFQNQGAPLWLAGTVLQWDGYNTVMARIAAIGLLARLWDPSLGGTSPRKEIAAWLRAANLNKEEIAFLLENLTHRAGQLALRIEEEEEDFSSSLRWIVEEREFLQSVRSALRTVVDTGFADGILRSLDERAEEMGLRLQMPVLPEDHAWSLAWMEPEAWWSVADPESPSA